jgi:hypothetical protein
VVTITRPAPGAGKAGAIAGAGLAAGFIVGAIGLLAGRKYTDTGLKQLELNERLDRIESRFGRGKELERRVRELAIQERLDEIQSHVRHATDTIRRRSKAYAKPTWADRLSSLVSKN